MIKRGKILSVIVSVALVGGVIYSCSKETPVVQDELTLKAASIKPTPALILSYDPAPALINEDVTISAMVSYLGVDLTCGQVQLFYAVDGNGNPCPVASVVNWVNPWGKPKDAPGGTQIFKYAAPGLYGWKAQYESSGPNCVYNNLTGNDAITLDIQVIEPNCSEPLTITPSLVSGESADGKTYLFTAKWKVKACESFTNLKTQGGLTAGSVVIKTTPNASNIKTTKQNTIINWVEPTVNAGDEFIYTVTFTRPLKNTCTTYDITGAWSAKAWHMVDYPEMLDGEGNVLTPAKTVNEEYVAGYNNKIYFTTPCN